MSPCPVDRFVKWLTSLCHAGWGTRASAALSCSPISSSQVAFACAVLQAAAPGSLPLSPAGTIMWQPRQPGCCCACGRREQRGQGPAPDIHLRWTLQFWPSVKMGLLPGALRPACWAWRAGGLGLYTAMRLDCMESLWDPGQQAAACVQLSCVQVSRALCGLQLG